MYYLYHYTLLALFIIGIRRTLYEHKDSVSNNIGILKNEYKISDDYITKYAPNGESGTRSFERFLDVLYFSIVIILPQTSI